MAMDVTEGLEKIMGENPVRLRTFAKHAIQHFIPIVGDIKLHRDIKRAHEYEPEHTKSAIYMATAFTVAKYLIYYQVASKSRREFVMV